MHDLARHRLPGTPQPTQRWKGADGIQLAGDAWGDPAAPLVVLLHGGGQTRHAWRGTGERIGAAGYRAIAYDARGHGDSGWATDGDYGFAAHVRDLRALLAEEGAKQAVLIGASMGGLTSLVAAAEGVPEVPALILVDVVPTPEQAGVDRIRGFMRQRLDGFDTLEQVADAIASYRGGEPRRADLSGLAKNVRRGDDGRYYWHYDPQFVHRTRDLRANAKLRDSAAALKMPVLLVRGGLSDVVSEESVRDFLALCPHAEYVNVASAGHMVAGDRNDAFGLAAIDFLRRIVPVHATHELQPSPPHPAG
jgi:non-heme chloroperoxidase